MESVNDFIKVSVVVPVYNTELYLKECIESILHQTLKEFELICVDDGSEDASVEIIRGYMDQDPRILLIEQSHQFAGAARNKGMATAHGKYIIFLDADDFFEPEMLEDLYQKAEATDSDIVLFGGNQYNDLTGEKNRENNWLNTKDIDENSVFSRNYYPHGFLLITNPATWTKLFNRSFIQKHNISFQKLQNTNDLYFTMLAMSCAERVSFINRAYVNYRTNLKTNIQSNKKPHPLDFCTALKELYSELKKRNLFDDVSESYVRLARTVILYSLDTADQETETLIIQGLQKEEYFINALMNGEPSDDNNADLIKRKLGTFNSFSTDEVEVMSSNNDPLCTVIIPVYNAEKNIDNCLNSIRKQTEKNIEIICVNAGSEDNSLAVMRKHAAEDHRITVVSRQNSRLSCAKNTGMKYATGQYIYFMDSDAILREDALKTLTEFMQDKNLDTVFFDADVIYDEEQTRNEKKTNRNPSNRRINLYEGVHSGKNIAVKMIKNQEYYESVSLQMNRRSFLFEHNNYFEPWPFYEEHLFTFRNILYGERVSCVNEPFYQKTLHKDQDVNVALTYLNCYTYFKCYLLIMRELFNYKQIDSIPEDIIGLPDNALSLSRDMYMNLPEEQRFEDVYLFGFEKAMFRKEILDYCRDKQTDLIKAKEFIDLKEQAELMKNTIEKQENDIAYNQMLYQEVKDSLSFKIGRSVTAVPRKIRNSMKKPDSKDQ